MKLSSTKRNFTFESSSGCVHEISSAQREGFITSPNYPEPYPPKISCKYSFTGQENERVQIKFTKLDLHYPLGDPSDPYE